MDTFSINPKCQKLLKWPQFGKHSKFSKAKKPQILKSKVTQNVLKKVCTGKTPFSLLCRQLLEPPDQINTDIMFKITCRPPCDVEMDCRS